MHQNRRGKGWGKNYMHRKKKTFFFFKLGKKKLHRVKNRALSETVQIIPHSNVKSQEWQPSWNLEEQQAIPPV